MPYEPVGPRDEAGDTVNIRDVWQAIMRRRWLIVVVTGAVLALTALYTAYQIPVYESGVTLRIDERDQTDELLGNIAPIAGMSRGKIETDMLVLESRTVAETVVDSLRLALIVSQPAVGGRELVVPVEIPRDAPVGEFVLERRDDGRYAVTADMREDFEDVEVPETIGSGEIFRIGSARLMLARRSGATAPETIVFRLADFRHAVTDLRNRLRVTRPDRDAHIVALAYSNHDPAVAAGVLNTVAATFLSYKKQTSKTESRSTVDFLRDQVRVYEQDLRGAEEQLRQFREANQVVSLQDEAQTQVQRLADLRAELDELRSSRQALASLLERVQRMPDGAEGTSPYRQLASFPLFLANRAIQDMLQSLNALETERAQLLVRRTSEDFDVRGLDERIAAIETELYHLAQNYLASLDNQIASIEGVLQRFGSQLETIPAREVEFARLLRQQELLGEMYTLLQTRLKEAEIREAVEPGDARIVDPALVPVEPVAPRPIRNLALGSVLGLMLGIGLAFFRQAMDTTVRSKEDAALVTAGAPVLGLIPRIRPGAVSVYAAGKENGNGRRPHLPTRRRAASQGDEQSLIALREPGNPAAEAFRALRTNLTFASADRSPQLIVLTSAMPGDGKSTSAANLAITLAQQGTRTLLLDADLRRGTMHKSFGVPAEPGLVHVLVGRAATDDAIREVSVGDSLSLHVMPVGVTPPNPAELLGSRRMSELADELRERFEVIVVDAPPLNLVTDAAILGTLADATVLVARVGITDKRDLQHAVAQVYHLGAPVSGIVLNDVTPENGGYSSSGYGYGAG